MPYRGGAPALTDLIGGHQRPRWNSIPFVGPAQEARDDEKSRAEAVAQQHRQRRLHHAVVAIVEGDADKPTLATFTHCVNECPDPDTAQAMLFQPSHLLGEAPRRHTHPVPSHLGQLVVHQDQRKLA